MNENQVAESIRLVEEVDIDDQRKVGMKENTQVMAGDFGTLLMRCGIPEEVQSGRGAR